MNTIEDIDTPILDSLGQFTPERIMDLELINDNKQVRLTEACDSYFYTDMNKLKFCMFIRELTSIAKLTEEE